MAQSAGIARTTRAALQISPSNLEVCLSSDPNVAARSPSAGILRRWRYLAAGDHGCRSASSLGPDQIARQVVALRQTMQRLVGQVLLDPT